MGSREQGAGLCGPRPKGQASLGVPTIAASSDRQGCRQGGAAPLSNSGVHRKDLAAPDTGL